MMEDFVNGFIQHGRMLESYLKTLGKKPGDELYTDLPGYYGAGSNGFRLL